MSKSRQSSFGVHNAIERASKQKWPPYREALANGLAYYQGEKCGRAGHDGIRRTSSRRCLFCEQEDRTLRHRAADRERRQLDPDVPLQRTRVDQVLADKRERDELKEVWE